MSSKAHLWNQWQLEYDTAGPIEEEPTPHNTFSHLKR
jgi:hypothetical protein